MRVEGKEGGRVGRRVRGGRDALRKRRTREDGGIVGMRAEGRGVRSVLPAIRPLALQGTIGAAFLILFYAVSSLAIFPSCTEAGMSLSRLGVYLKKVGISMIKRK